MSRNLTNARKNYQKLEVEETVQNFVSYFVLTDQNGMPTNIVDIK